MLWQESAARVDISRKGWPLRRGLDTRAKLPAESVSLVQPRLLSCRYVYDVWGARLSSAARATARNAKRTSSVRSKDSYVTRVQYPQRRTSGPPLLFEARDDAAALLRARASMSDEHIEVWEGMRRVQV
jgi:hypothetical protein